MDINSITCDSYDCNQKQKYKLDDRVTVEKLAFICCNYLIFNVKTRKACIRVKTFRYFIIIYYALN